MSQLPFSTMWGILLTWLGMSPKRWETYHKKASTTNIDITVSIIVKTWVLTLTCSSTIRPALVICSLDSWTLSSTNRAIHGGESLTKTLPWTRHLGTVTWGDYILLPLSNPMGLNSLLGILGLGISGTIKQASVFELAVPEWSNPN